MTTHPSRPRIHLHVLHRLQPLFLLPSLALSLNAQPVMDQMEKAIVWEWPVVWPDTVEGHIALSTTDAANGPWIPWLEPIARGPGYCRLPVQATDAARFFALALGRWLMDDFDDGLFTGWGEFLYPSGFDIVSIEEAEGRLRVSGDCATCDRRGVYFYRNEIETADIAASIDILDWDESGANQQNIAIVVRLFPEDPLSEETSTHYLAGVTTSWIDTPGQSILWIARLDPAFQNLGGGPTPIPKMEPSNDYRLVFYMVGNKGTVKLFNLSDPNVPPETFEAVDDGGQPLTSGWIGFHVSENSGPGGTLDVTVDNFVAAGTLSQ